MNIESGDSGHDTDPIGSELQSEIPHLPMMPEGVDFGDVQAELMKQTERGMAVLAGAYLEWRVRQAIERRMYRWEATPTGKTKPEPVGASVFGTDETAGKIGFGDQCKIAYCLGLVGQIGYFDLKRIAKIRNRFAHHMEVTTFAGDKKVRELCEELETPKAFNDSTARLVERETGMPDPTIGNLIHDGTHRSMYLTTVQLIWIMLYQVAAYLPPQWPNPEGSVVFW